MANKKSRKVPSTAACALLASDILKAWKDGLASPELSVRMQAAKDAAPYAIQKMPTDINFAGFEEFLKSLGR